MLSLNSGEAGTYRDWLQLLERHPCLKGPETTVMQGDLDVPLLASGEAAEFVALRAALAVADEAATCFPTAENNLAKAAVLVALAQFHAQEAESHGFENDRTAWLSMALEFLDGIPDKELALEDEDLRPIQREIRSRALLLNGQPDQARDLLLATPDDVLKHRALASRLVNMADEVSQREPAILLQSVSKRLADLQGKNEQAADLESSRAALDSLLARESARRAEPFRITSSTSVELAGAR